MGQFVRIERRKRGFFGWLFLLLFVAFNVLMLVWLASYWIAIGPRMSEGSAAAQAGSAIGATMGTGLILSMWTCGAIILGLFALLTRGRKIVIEERYE
ncbi:hypothetical protein DW352_03255 [Pseudolabrys taiwanensis]|uniref:Uncharacterized protein n=1 Tax=Pseudolabrys taiwanensis TaxID=331696 RepID=A0A345ZRS4_9HYPH|nr:hypothetical protein [Pseudolabrys taiwanensis]AXK79621.1 hypothetical protein DW352_03255 [Pseudolabrys taiwanensis]